MFDVKAIQDVFLEGIVFLPQDLTGTVDVYYATDGYTGKEGNSAAWTKIVNAESFTIASCEIYFLFRFNHAWVYLPLVIQTRFRIFIVKYSLCRSFFEFFTINHSPCWIYTSVLRRSKFTTKVSSILWPFIP